MRLFKWSLAIFAISANVQVSFVQFHSNKYGGVKPKSNNSYNLLFRV